MGHVRQIKLMWGSDGNDDCIAAVRCRRERQRPRVVGKTALGDTVRRCQVENEPGGSETIWKMTNAICRTAADVRRIRDDASNITCTIQRQPSRFYQPNARFDDAIEPHGDAALGIIDACYLPC